MRPGHTIDDPKTRYLWNRRLARGAVNVIFSRPGRGKSTLGAALTGHVTDGRKWPDGSPCEAGYVMYMKGEGTDASIRDRMQLAGATPERYGIVSKAAGMGEAMIDLALDTGPLCELLDQHPDTRLLIVDTLDSMFPSMRMIDNANIRRCLWPLQELAEQRDLCIVIFAHTNKGGYADPLDRLSGGRAIGGAARSIWYLGKLDPEADECFFTPVKTNDFLPAPTLSYRIDGIGPDSPGVICWTGERDEVSAWELDVPRQAGNSNKADECRDWLAELLAGGPVETSDATTRAENAGFGRRVLKKAKDALNVQNIAAKGSRPTRWYLCLPGQYAPTSDARSGNVSTPPYDPPIG